MGISPLTRIWGGGGRSQLGDGVSRAGRVYVRTIPCASHAVATGPFFPIPGTLPAPSLYWRNWVSRSVDLQRAAWGRTQPAVLRSARSNSDPGFGFTAAVGGRRELEAVFHLGVSCQSTMPSKAAAACF